MTGNKVPFGATPIDEDDRIGLIPEHITTREELNAAEFANINCAYVKYFSRTPSRRKAPFTCEWLKKLHYEMFGDVWEWAGKLRIKDIAPGVPVAQIATEFYKFQGDVEAWEKYEHDLLEIAVKIHHRLVWIHPFRNGNGRWARLASNIYLRRNSLAIVQWPEGEFLVADSLRKEYVSALQKADRGSFAPLLEIHKRFLN